MIEIFGETYFIDFEELNNFLISDNTFNPNKKVNEIEITTNYDPKGNIIGQSEVKYEKDKPKEINVVRYDIIRGLIDDLGSSDGEEDEVLGAANLNKTSIRFKLAYNTLVYYDILKKFR